MGEHFREIEKDAQLDKQIKEFKDSGTRQRFETGANRDLQAGKGRYDLVPPFPIMFLSRIYEDGCKKYGDRNWERGIPIARYVDSAKRHLEKYQAGLRDEPHLSMAFWNISGALWTAAMVMLNLRPISLYDLPSHVGAIAPLPLSSYEAGALENFIGHKLPAIGGDNVASKG
jgi:Domain of unknown function (DUF5664)